LYLIEDFLDLLRTPKTDRSDLLSGQLSGVDALERKVGARERVAECGRTKHGITL
jgi:hypothetical protein